MRSTTVSSPQQKEARTSEQPPVYYSEAEGAGRGWRRAKQLMNWGEPAQIWGAEGKRGDPSRGREEQGRRGCEFILFNHT
jgi:hypothetical protein